MITAKDLAVEVVRVSQMSTLRRAALNESLTDVIGVHAGVLRGRLGTWDSRTELDAVAYLTEAVQEAVDSADFQDHDDAEIEESDLIERIGSMS